ncbi:sensor domain-containing diguanylate cyclase [Devosia sp.]|uniref:sensor domain-containing diguanylate cyclase n=1 Tax=Devosia sp. TaxID=1871048 RepID=UPI001B068B80|nr:sensor domain-containing diguanylate cyclase [Devosia sp.]MBO9588483.1 diguanylate cyclase [Devosia sp.]
MDSSAPAASKKPGLAKTLVAATLTAVIVFLLALLGIYTRAAFDLASLWPANAVLLGILATYPKANSPLTWVLAACAYMAADLMTGTPLDQAALLNGTNLLGAAIGLAVLQLWSRQFFPMTKPSDVVRLFLVISAASVSTGIAGGLVAGPLFGIDRLDGFFLWMATEFVNYGIFLPLVMAGRMVKPRQTAPGAEDGSGAAEKCAALAALAGSCALMPLVGGAGSLVLHVPAFIWCSTQFKPRTSILLAGLAAMWILFAVPAGIIPLYVDHADLASHWDVASFRLGIGFLALGAIAMVMINAFWLDAHDELEHRANHDFLTGLLNRRQFNKTAESALMRQKAGTPNVALAIDIDRFKSINDAHGHPLGDQVLQSVAELLTAGLRRGDVLGRLGGEEFAIVLPGAGIEEGTRVAERLREAIAAATLQHGNVTIATSVSIGIVEFHSPANLSRMLSLADEALYEAKNAGRNRVVAHKSAVLLQAAGA